MAGLLAAAACAGSGRSVLVLDRDEAPGVGQDGEPLPRNGVPQARHPHVFLYRGLLEAEKLLPGLREELVRRGGVPFDTSRVAWHGDLGWMPAEGRAFEVVSATRPLLDDVVRARVEALPGVEVRWGARVDGLDRRRGAWCVRVNGAAEGNEAEADLVIDASGRASRLPLWLRRLGFAEPAVEEIDARVGYATRMYHGPPHVLDAPAVVLLAPPDDPVGGAAFGIENDRWLVTAVGFGDRRPPRDVEGFETFLRTLPDPALTDLTTRCRPIGDVVIHRQTANRRHHYERLADLPEGLLVVGDALCTFNPIYGQGITVAACEAVLLRDALDAAVARGRLPRGSCAVLLRRFASVVDLPWSLATGEDRRFLPPAAAVRTGVVERMVGAWVRHLSLMATHGDDRARMQLSRMYHLVASPAALFSPALVASALRAAVVGYGPAEPRPASLEALHAAVSAAS